jgi:flagellar protein FlbD
VVQPSRAARGYKEQGVIVVTRLNGEELVVNAGLIEFIEATPDTLISLMTGKKIMVRESRTEIIDRSVAYFQRIGLQAVLHAGGFPEDPDVQD